MNLSVKKRLTDIQNRLVAAGGRGSGRDGVGVWGAICKCICKLLYTEWINNKVLLYSTGNYILYPVINHNGKGKKESSC